MYIKKRRVMKKERELAKERERTGGERWCQTRAQGWEGR